MGHNATVVVLLDALHEIEEDQDFGKKLAHAIMMEAGGARYRQPDVSAGNHCNAATVIESHHADQTVLVAVGGNYGSVIGRFWGDSHHEEADKLKLLKRLADSMGYYIAKYPKRKRREDDTSK